MAGVAQGGGAKERRRKQILIAGTLLFVALLALQLPRTLKLLRGPGTPGGVVATPESELTPTPTPTVDVDPTGARPDLGPGKLVSLDRFAPKALFVSQGTIGASAPPAPKIPAGVPTAVPGFSFGTTPPPPRPSPPPASPPVPRPSPQRGGYVVVLASVPADSGRAEADRAARKLRAAGFRGVRVLNSGNYKTLRRGYYAVVSRAYRNRADALAARTVAHARGVARPYVRPLVR